MELFHPPANDSCMSLIPLLPIAAAGWSLLYLLLGGGFLGALVIFVVLKMFRR
jgi:hypothetical protein